MPLYYFKCSGCKSEFRKILEPLQAKYHEIFCPCGGKVTRLPKAPTTKVVETLDNGLMPKKLERLSEAERIFKERSKNKP